MEKTLPASMDTGDDDRSVPEIKQGIGDMVQKLADATEARDAEALWGVARDWSAHCIGAYTGELLARGMDVAKAIAEFANELDNGE